MFRDVEAAYSKDTVKAGNMIEHIKDPTSDWNSWATSDRFLGKLEKSLERVQDKVAEDHNMKCALQMGAELDFESEPLAIMSKLQEIQECITKLGEAMQRIRDVADMDDSSTQ